MDSYTQFLTRFFETTPEQLTTDLQVRGKQLFYDPAHAKEFCDEHKIEPQSFGIFLGETKKEFDPSPACIERISTLIDVRRTAMIDKQGSWLFLCGRDIFGAAIRNERARKGAAVILFDDHENLLGYGTWLTDRIMPSNMKRPVINNELDMGMYLRTKD